MISKTFCLFFLVSSFLVIADDEVISWQDSSKLTWNEFKATPKKNLSAVALTASGITFEYSVKEKNSQIVSFNAKVDAYFYPNKSWVNKKDATDHILAHEQLHFDITELYARKFRMQISQLKISKNLKSQLRDLHIDINNRLAVAQNLYDKESDNSVNMEYQAKWNTYVKEELAKLESYKLQD